MENDEHVSARLLALASAPAGRSKIGRLRTWLPAIEASLKAGVSLDVILEELNSQGLEMKFGAFKTALYRIRKEGLKKPIPSAVPMSGLTPKKESLTPKDTSSSSEETEYDESLSKSISPKERRERLANQFITSESTNSLLNRINKGNK